LRCPLDFQTILFLQQKLPAFEEKMQLLGKNCVFFVFFNMLIIKKIIS